MKQLPAKLLLATSVAGLLLSASFAQAASNPNFRADSLTGDQRSAIKERIQNATPEQKAAMKEKMKERMQNATPEEKAARRAKMKEKYQSMSPEQQSAFKAKLKERRAGRGIGQRAQ